MAMRDIPSDCMFVCMWRCECCGHTLMHCSLMPHTHVQRGLKLQTYKPSPCCASNFSLLKFSSKSQMYVPAWCFPCLSVCTYIHLCVHEPQQRCLNVCAYVVYGL